MASSPLKAVYDPKAFLPHAALLRQASAHCARFPTAASRRSLGRVSVPVWLIVLSDQLRIVALVGRYPHQQANAPRAHPKAEAEATISRRHLGADESCGISPSFLGLSPASRQIPTRYSPVRHSPPMCIATHCAAVRLACVKHAASVQSEPGSNSPIYK